MGYKVSKITRNKWQDRHLSRTDNDAWQQLRKQAVAANTCSICGCKGTRANPIQGGHIVSVSKGGRNTKLNLQGECRKCNMKKAKRGKL